MRSQLGRCRSVRSVQWRGEGGYAMIALINTFLDDRNGFLRLLRYFDDVVKEFIFDF